MSEEPRQKRQEILVVALARGETLTTAARLAGVSERTVRRRLKNDEFAQRVRKARASMINRASGQLADAAAEAVEALRSLLKSDRDSIRLSAARSALELCCRFRQSEELEDRVCQLEERLSVQSQESNSET